MAQPSKEKQSQMSEWCYKEFLSVKSNQTKMKFVKFKTIATQKVRALLKIRNSAQ